MQSQQNISQEANSPPHRRSRDEDDVLPKKSIRVLALDASHTGPDLADEEDLVKDSKSATVRYQPEPLTKEELDFFLSLNFEAGNIDTSMAAGSSCASFPLDTVLVENCSACGLQDSSSTLQSNISSLSMATASANSYHPNHSFSTLQSSSSSSTSSPLRDDAIANQVQGQAIKLISTMKRSAESRGAVQRMVHTFPPARPPNATFDINISATHYNRNTPHPSGSGMDTVETKRKHEAMDTGEDAAFKDVRTRSVFDFRV
jgi:hypothetical protein